MADSKSEASDFASSKSEKSEKEEKKKEKKEKKEAEKKEKKEKKEAEKREKRERKQREIEAEEQKALAQFKEKLQNVKLPPGFDNDKSHLRFLRARKLDADKAYDMLIKCLEWREKEKPESITWESIQREMAQGKSVYLGLDRCRRPCFLIFPGRHEPKSISNEETVRALIYHVEQAIKQMEPNVEQVSLLVDFEGWSLKNVDHDLDKMMIDTIQNYYPERLGSAFVVNAPTVFKVAWAVVRPWLDEKTTSKIFFLSGDNVKEKLLEHMDPEVLPVKYGGNNTISLEPPKSAAPKGPPKAMSMKKD